MGEQSKEILQLKRQLEILSQQCEEHKQALQQAQKQLEVLSRPALNEGFFRHLAQALELWDQALIEEARELGGRRLEPWLKAIWEEREAALSRALAGEIPDWRRVRTSLVLEWALLTWLEGIRDG
ncbi:hypothetical protein [Thermus amyloliquefaciens]|uniref:hypothetical protein n=1 Tax=Thermus amyloliquefaciens TaxID=1449080 RepID=UPI000A82A262|nr:hypothetical protein [Thermus amyloliquefaciens]